LQHTISRTPGPPAVTEAPQGSGPELDGSERRESSPMRTLLPPEGLGRLCPHCCHWLGPVWKASGGGNVTPTSRAM
jgi:hypothetical protein